MRTTLFRSLFPAACILWMGACGGGKSSPEDSTTDETDVPGETLDALDGEVSDAVEDTFYDMGDSTECPDGQAYNPYLTPPRCVECTRACDLEGETGEVWEITAQSGECVCTTQDGYYFSLSGAAVSHQCDVDGDGWVTSSARANIESEDPAIAANARCDLRVVDRFVLLREGLADTEGCAVVLSETDLGVDSLGLYEADRRDDQDLLDEDVNAPVYGSRKLYAQELNGLTKACVSLIGDFNANDTADVNEWDLDGDPLHAFAYFIELHRGWYEDGAYHIQEKSRDADPPVGFAIPLVYNDDAYWRQCVRMNDSAFDPLGPNAIGMDFARYNTGECDPLMHHHSQYKCVHLVESNDDPEAYPQRLPMSELEVTPRRYVLNGCGAEDVSLEPVVGAVNPRDADLTCEINTAPAIDDVGFVAVKYLHYDDDPEDPEYPDDYIRGCVNGCIDDPPICPPAASCQPDITDYGKAECVCPNHWTGPDCDVCPPYWDETTDCSECLNNFDPATDCAACLASYDVTSECTVCIPRWDITTGCTTCINNYDVATDCATCLYHYDLSTGCTECELHYDPFTLCSTCLWNWDVTDNCESCIKDGGDPPEEIFLSSSDCRRSGNLLDNPGAETGDFTSWTRSYSYMTTSSSHCGGHVTVPHSGSYRFLCCLYDWSECRMYQEVDLASYEEGIDAGRYTLEIDAWILGYDGDGGIWVDFYDITMAPLGSSTHMESADNTWTRLSDSVAIPPDTRYIRVWLDTDRAGSDTDVAFDDISIVIVE